MIIEVGKWKTRDGQRVDVVEAPIIGGSGQYLRGVINGVEHTWDRQGRFLWKPATHPFDLISPWEAEDKSMVPNFRAFFKERFGRDIDYPVNGTPISSHFQEIADTIAEYVDRTLGVATSAIKSVEPAPPGVGDRCQWECEPPRVLLAHGDDWSLWRSQSGGLDARSRPLEAIAAFPGFRIIKRAEPK
jgi:hypothetical protein